MALVNKRAWRQTLHTEGEATDGCGQRAVVISQLLPQDSSEVWHSLALSFWKGWRAEGRGWEEQKPGEADLVLCGPGLHSPHPAAFHHRSSYVRILPEINFF